MNKISSQKSSILHVIEAGIIELSDSSSSARLDCLILLELILHKDRAWLLANQNTHSLTNDQIRSFEELLSRRKNHEPIAYLTERIEFYGLELMIDKSVLVPRPETESLVEAVIKVAKPNDRVIDVGTGSGAIGLALKKSKPSLNITISDLSTSALEIAKRNINKYALHDIKLVHSDLMDDINGQFNIIVANLPYLEKGVDNSTTISREPDSALYSDNNGLYHYEKLFEQISQKHALLESGYLIIEAKPTQHNLLAEMAGDHLGVARKKLKLSSDYCMVLS